MKNSIGIDVKGHLNLRHAPGSRFNSLQIEGPEYLVVSKKRTLSLADSDRYFRLIVRSG